MLAEVRSVPKARSSLRVLRRKTAARLSSVTACRSLEISSLVSLVSLERGLRPLGVSEQHPAMLRSCRREDRAGSSRISASVELDREVTSVMCRTVSIGARRMKSIKCWMTSPSPSTLRPDTSSSLNGRGSRSSGDALTLTPVLEIFSTSRAPSGHWSSIKSAKANLLFKDRSSTRSVELGTPARNARTWPSARWVPGSRRVSSLVRPHKAFENPSIILTFVDAFVSLLALRPSQPPRSKLASPSAPSITARNTCHGSNELDAFNVFKRGKWKPITEYDSAAPKNSLPVEATDTGRLLETFRYSICCNARSRRQHTFVSMKDTIRSPRSSAIAHWSSTSPPASSSASSSEPPSSIPNTSKLTSRRVPPRLNTFHTSSNPRRASTPNTGPSFNVSKPRSSLAIKYTPSNVTSEHRRRSKYRSMSLTCAKHRTSASPTTFPSNTSSFRRPDAPACRMITSHSS
mmetsp:Transcript_3256/g.9598  ORF Transcript_3256/g.9598 Transcript_3256/m.9598 type:complete len:461 (-) Transcript_3256:394-1776(-)